MAVFVQILCFDLDNVICDTKKNFYKKSKPKVEVINYINNLFEKGHTIKIYTARFMGRSKDNRQKQLWQQKITINQLKNGMSNIIKFFLETIFDILIDDKSFGFKANWLKSLKKKINN